MDRHRGDRSGNYQDSFHGRHSSRTLSRYSDNQHRSHNNFRGGFSGGGGGTHQRYHPFDSPPNHPLGGGGSGGFRPMGGSGGGGFGPAGGYPPPISGQKRGVPFSGSAGSPPDSNDGSGFAKLFIGSVPRTATEEDIRPLFEEHGNVIEVALIKDKRTGQQQGCCFIKYATSEEADRAIRALHNQYTLPGGVGPIQVRYADGERERLGSVEHKLFVGSLNKQATEKEVEEIFSPYGRVEDVYIMRDEMKYSRGCGFVKFSHRDMAAAAINALNGIYVMRGCEQPLTVRFADPKRPRGGDSRGGPTFGGPGFGPRSQAPSGFRPPPNQGDPPMGGRVPTNEWHHLSPKDVGPPPQVGAHGFDNHFAARVGVAPVLPAMGGPMGVLGGPANGSFPGVTGLPSTSLPTSSESFTSQVPSIGRQISPSQRPLQSPQHLVPPLQRHPQQVPVAYSQTQTSPASMQHLGQLQIPSSSSQSSFSQALQSPLLYGLNGQVPISQPQFQQGVPSSAAQLIPLNMQRQGSSATTSHQQLPLPASQQPTQLAQVLSQQTQALQASFQSSQQAFSQLQQQLHQMQQQSSQNSTQQQNLQATKQQSPWTGTVPQGVSSSPATAPVAVMPSTTAAPAASVSSQMVASLTCNWTEHTSPEGYKYFYNSVTGESRWEKPEELILFEQQKQQQQKPSVQQVQSQSRSHPQVLSTQQSSQTQQIPFQTQINNQQQLQLQRPPFSSLASGAVGQQNTPDLGYIHSQATANFGTNPAGFQQGPQAAQDWMWKNKPAGA